MKSLDKKIILQKRKYKSLEILTKKLDRIGAGEVLTSIRKKLKTEKTKAAHGHKIVVILRKLHDIELIQYTDGLLQNIQAGINRSTRSLIIESAKRKRAQSTDALVAQIRRSADVLALDARDNLQAGKSGEVIKKTYNYKKNLVKRGLITDKYGNPPPMGIRSGRLVEGIRGRYRLQKKRKK